MPKGYSLNWNGGQHRRQDPPGCAGSDRRDHDRGRVDGRREHARRYRPRPALRQSPAGQTPIQPHRRALGLPRRPLLHLSRAARQHATQCRRRTLSEIGRRTRSPPSSRRHNRPTRSRLIMAEQLILSDAVGALVEYLSKHTLIQAAGRCQYVTAPLLSKQNRCRSSTIVTTRDRAQVFGSRLRPGARRAGYIRFYAN